MAAAERLPVLPRRRGGGAGAAAEQRPPWPWVAMPDEYGGGVFYLNEQTNETQTEFPDEQEADAEALLEEDGYEPALEDHDAAAEGDGVPPEEDAGSEPAVTVPHAPGDPDAGARLEIQCDRIELLDGPGDVRAICLAAEVPPVESLPGSLAFLSSAPGALFKISRIVGSEKADGRPARRPPLGLSWLDLEPARAGDARPRSLRGPATLTVQLVASALEEAVFAALHSLAVDAAGSKDELRNAGQMAESHSTADVLERLQERLLPSPPCVSSSPHALFSASSSLALLLAPFFHLLLLLLLPVLP
ncbi:unnamed protein product, partial [Prorocentrum cordatum]